MRILLSNDDGVHAPGIQALFQEIAPIAETIVVAPASERSAVGHAISVYNDVTLSRHLREGEPWAYALDGTPADCVKMAVTHLLRDARPDLVLSGINRGQNTGTSIIYSGTVAAALEATMLGLPAVALSLAVIAPFVGLPDPPNQPDGDAVNEEGQVAYAQAGGSFQPAALEQRAPASTKDLAAFRAGLARKVEDYIPAARFAARLAKIVAERGLPKGNLLNVNVPMVPEHELAGAVITKMGHSAFVDQFKLVREADGHEHYRNIGDTLVPSAQGDDWDDLVLHQKKISITPLHYDLTSYDLLDELRGWFSTTPA